MLLRSVFMPLLFNILRQYIVSQICLELLLHHWTAGNRWPRTLCEKSIKIKVTVRLEKMKIKSQVNNRVETGLEIPDRPVTNAMRNGEGLQLIPNTVARLAIIFFTTWYVKIACFHNIKRCWKWPASHRLHASWFSLCVAWMNGFRAQGTGLRYYGMCKYRACDWPAWDARLLSVFFGYQAWSDN